MIKSLIGAPGSSFVAARMLGPEVLQAPPPQQQPQTDSSGQQQQQQQQWRLTNEEFVTTGQPIVIRGVNNQGWNKSVFDRCYDHTTEELATVAAESVDRQFQSIECPVNWQQACSSRLGPGFWGPGDMNVSNDPLQPKTIAGGSFQVESFVPMAVSDCCAIRSVLFVYGDSGATLCWMVVGSSDKQKALEQWRVSSGSDQTIFVSPTELAKSQFPVYVIEQHVGDLVIIPPDCVCQGVTFGGHVVAVNWYRQNPFSLELAYNKTLPAMRRECITPLLPIKALVYNAMLARVEIMERGEAAPGTIDPPPRELAALLRVLGKILSSEWVDLFELQKVRNQTEVEAKYVPDGLNQQQRLCSHCKTQLFNRCYRCQQCTDANGGNPVNLCLECVMEGQRCDHLKSFVLYQIISIGNCRSLLHRAIQIYNKLAGGGGEALITSLCNDEVSAATVAFNLVQLAIEDQRATCHQCKLAKPRHRMVFCTNQNAETHKKKTRPCCKKFCMSCLWNRYMIKQWECLKHKSWTCPFCNKICNCSACLRKRGVDPNSYELPFTIPQMSDEAAPTTLDGIDSGGSANAMFRNPRPRLRRKQVKDDSSDGAKAFGSPTEFINPRPLVDSSTVPPIKIEEAQPQQLLQQLQQLPPQQLFNQNLLAQQQQQQQYLYQQMQQQQQQQMLQNQQGRVLQMTPSGTFSVDPSALTSFLMNNGGAVHAVGDPSQQQQLYQQQQQQPPNIRSPSMIAALSSPPLVAATYAAQAQQQQQAQQQAAQTLSLVSTSPKVSPEGEPPTKRRSNAGTSQPNASTSTATTTGGGSLEFDSSISDLLCWSRVGPFSPWYPARRATDHELADLHPDKRRNGSSSGTTTASTAATSSQSIADGFIAVYFFGEHMCLFVRQQDVLPFESLLHQVSEDRSDNLRRAVDEAILWARSSRM